MLKLIFPTEKHELLWYDIVKEIEETGEKIIPYALSFRQHNYEFFLQKTRDAHNGIKLEGFVPATTYFLMEEEENKILGATNIRHNLNDDLLLHGGHIGYGICPSERKKGYASQMLSLALDKCRELGIQKALVTCDKDNVGSARTIQKNGGVLENEIVENDGNVVQRYWIDLKE